MAKFGIFDSEFPHVKLMHLKKIIITYSHEVDTNQLDVRIQSNCMVISY